MSVVAPGSRPKATPRPPALIEDRIPLPGRFLLSDFVRLVENGAEQHVIRLIRQPQGGESLHGIAREINRRLAPTKNAGLREANTAGRIFHRIAPGREMKGNRIPELFPDGRRRRMGRPPERSPGVRSAT